MRRLFRLSALAAAAATAAPLGAQAPAGGNGDLYDTAKQLFDQYAPPEVKQQYDFPTRADFDRFVQKVQDALEGGSLQELAQYEPQARAALLVMRQSPQYADSADWLEARLNEIDAARTAVESEPAPPAPSPAQPAPPRVPVPEAGRPPATSAARPPIPYYELWYRRESGRPAPANAARLMPGLRSAFASEGVPPELAWIAEVESSFSPTAASPAGARGLFQLKADTAKRFGLSTFLPDERTDPEKSARASARYLRTLHERFGSWPLAIAAYNAGEGRVSRALAARHADSFAGIAPALPAGTRMYVPEVCALVAVRTGRNLR
ncbi:MAG TPA: lytic transglycosylase domain-containing protein [Opitutaceae bacterium]|nr:lytic transglycosylase domain-containing protein [Opitutaceae bacterium]